MTKEQMLQLLRQHGKQLVRRHLRNARLTAEKIDGHAVLCSKRDHAAAEIDARDLSLEGRAEDARSFHDADPVGDDKRRGIDDAVQRGSINA